MISDTVYWRYVDLTEADEARLAAGLPLMLDCCEDKTKRFWVRPDMSRGVYNGRPQQIRAKVTEALPVVASR